MPAEREHLTKGTCWCGYEHGPHHYIGGCWCGRNHNKERAQAILEHKIQERTRPLEAELEEWRSVAARVLYPYVGTIVRGEEIQCNGMHIAHELCALVGKPVPVEPTSV